MYDALLVFTLLAILDIITTKRGLELGAYEANPIARKFLEKFGIKGLFILKYLGGALILLFTFEEWGLWVLNIFMALVVAWNSFVVIRLLLKI